MDKKNLLLLSNSTNFGSGFLDHAFTEIKAFLGHTRKLSFIPFALYDVKAYTRRVNERFEEAAIDVTGIPFERSAFALIEESEAIFVGGGNTFRLLRAIEELGIKKLIRDRVESGLLRYVGSSAGANLACPTIMTTNDMPIVHPSTFDALNLLPFQINPHYPSRQDPVREGEPRDLRLAEFLEENATPIVAIREGAWLRVEAGRLLLGGKTGGRLFERGKAPEDLLPGSDLTRLLRPQETLRAKKPRHKSIQPERRRKRGR